MVHTVDQSVEMTRRQKGRLTKVLVLCAFLFGFALIDTFIPDWKEQTIQHVEKYWDQLKPLLSQK